jgi:hypothetical protein
VLWTVGSIAGSIEDSRQKKSAKAGFWGGFMLFIMTLIYQVSIFIATSFPNNEIFQGFNIWTAIAGSVFGFLAFSGGKKMLPPKATGWIILLITFLSFYSLLHYVFIRTYNELLLSLITGLTFGVFAFFASSPATIKEFLKSHNV